ncbi:MAG TPA: cyanophycinase [Chitinophagaceae bacterium]|nr:cyanophycinase [Chitinophagaceae bacterium]
MDPKGKLLIIGGAEDKGNNGTDMEGKNKDFQQFQILRELLPTKNGKKKIEIITTASSMPEEMEKTYKEAFKKIGYPEIGFLNIKDKQEARDPKLVARVEKAHAAFFTGGDQFKLSTILGGTDLVSMIKERYYHDSDFVLAGTSAGAMVMSKIMIYEGGVTEAILKNDMKLTAGLGFFDTCIIDTHFIRRGRFGRLAHAITMNPEALGIGLGEDTAMIIEKGDRATCRGSGMVVIIDGSEIEQTNITNADDDTPIFVESLKVHLLCDAVVFSIKERKVEMEKAKRKAQPQQNK